LQPYDDTKLHQGMVFVTEPLVADSGGFYHVDELVAVGEDSGSVLSRTADSSAPYVIGGP
jgi:Xaa-Pro aminopeptidase